MNYKKHHIKTIRICINITKENYDKLEKYLKKTGHLIGPV